MGTTLMPTNQKKKHKNDETTVECPVEGCDKEVLSRGLHLHVMRSDSNGHGTQNEIPNNLNLEDAETVGHEEVEMEYPEERDTEKIARLCPYCERPFRGKHGVMIHLGQVAGRKNHPEDAPEQHEPDDLAIVHVDDQENVVEVVEEGPSLPATNQRKDDDALNEGQVKEHIKELREQGLEKEARRAEKMLLGN